VHRFEQTRQLPFDFRINAAVQNGNMFVDQNMTQSKSTCIAHAWARSPEALQIFSSHNSEIVLVLLLYFAADPFFIFFTVRRVVRRIHVVLILLRFGKACCMLYRMDYFKENISVILEKLQSEV